jgi:hypothetical protein
LAAGEQVVIDGLEKLKNGSKVSPKKDTPKSGSKSSKGGGVSADAAQPDSKARDAKPGHKDKAEDGNAIDQGTDRPHEHHHHGQHS